MRTISVDVPDETAAQLERAAEDRGLTVGELVREALDEKAREWAADFDSAADLVLSKNAELYRRLS